MTERSARATGEATLNDWAPEQRQLVFPNAAGRITRYGAFLELVWQPLLRKAALPYREPHAMRHSYATWLLGAGADIRWVKDQPASRGRRRPSEPSA